MTTLAEFDPGSEQFLLEERARLSESVLWKLQREYFQRAGIGAWSGGTVPHYITSNAALADASADVVFGFLCDYRGSASVLDGNRVNIIELGGGAGRFAYLFLKALHARWAESPGRAAPFRYLVTDFVRENVEFCRSHPGFQNFIDQRLLDFAIFDATADSELHLENSGETLAPMSHNAPLVVIANYVFDGLPHDAFVVQDGQLFERLISLSSDKLDAAGTSLEDVQLKWSLNPVEFQARYYDDSRWNDILWQYAQTLDEASFLFPSAVFSCLNRLRELADGGFLLLCTDKGQHHIERVAQPGDLPIAVHGSVSVCVNFHVIQDYFERFGGLALLMPQTPAHIDTGAFLFGGASMDYNETRLAYHRSIEVFGPDDFYTLKSLFRNLSGNFDLEALLSFIRLSRCDVRVLLERLDGIRTHAPKAAAAVKEDIKRLALQAWENYFHIGEEEDVAFKIGFLLFELGDYEQAARLFEESQRTWGPDSAALWNIGVCYCAIGKAEEGAAWFRKASEFDPGFRPTAALQPKLVRTPEPNSQS
jgi:tetratricopeptide (TPR) repeat protein